MDEVVLGSELLYFIVNPISGNGKSLKVFPELEKYLNEKHIKYEALYTKYKGHAIELVQEVVLKAHDQIIVVVGGDGTLNEVINGLQTNVIPIGYIPTGTGNDYAREMNIPKDPLLALKRILEKNIRKIDIGKINQNYFVNVASMGFDAEIAKYANQTKLKKFLGRFVYVLGVIKTLRNFKPKGLDITIDNKIYSFNRVWLIAIANNRFYGGGMVISPNAKNNDGLFDICVIKDINGFQLLKLFPTVFSGKHVKYPMVKIIRGKNITINTEEQLVIQTDGEIIEHMNINAEVLYHGIAVL